MWYLDIFTIGYTVVTLVFLFFCYILKKDVPTPKFNSPEVEDPCIWHKDCEGNEFRAKIKTWNFYNIRELQITHCNQSPFS